MAKKKKYPVVAEGEVPFVRLPDGRVIMGRFVTILKALGPGWDPEEKTLWTLAFDGREFQVTGNSWLPIDERWATRGYEPMEAHADETRFVVAYYYFWMHHLGWRSGDVLLVFDLAAMTVLVRDDTRFEPD